MAENDNTVNPVSGEAKPAENPASNTDSDAEYIRILSQFIPDIHRRAKEYRQARRTAMLLDNLDKLAEITKSDLSVDERCKIEKVYGDRQAVEEGKATERIEHSGGIRLSAPVLVLDKGIIENRTNEKTDAGV